MIDFKIRIDLELLVAAIIVESNPSSAEELSRISEELHNYVEIAIQDELSEKEWFDDYDPLF